jgi:hypothetical protein
MDACIPDIPGKKMPSAGIADYLGELLRLSPAQLMGTGILLRARLGATLLTAGDEYRVPADRDLVIFQVHAMVRSAALAAEVTPNAIFAGLTYADLRQLKMDNVVVNLLNKDRQLKVFDNRDMNLGALAQTPMYFPANAPLLVPSTHTLRADFTVQDATAAIVGQDADYGLVLTGVLIPKRV